MDLCLSVMLNSLSCSFTSIYFLTKCTTEFRYVVHPTCIFSTSCLNKICFEISTSQKIECSCKEHERENSKILSYYIMYSLHRTPKKASFFLYITGEMLFVPAGCPHRVENLEPSLAISSNFVDKSNFDHVKQELEINSLLDVRSEELLLQFNDVNFNESMDMDIKDKMFCEFKIKK